MATPDSETNVNILDSFRAGLNAVLDSIPDAPKKHNGRQKWLSQKCNNKISVGTAGKWLSGGGMPDWPNVFLLTEVLRCSIDELVGRKPVDENRAISIPIQTDSSDRRGITGKISFEDGVLTSMRIHKDGVELVVVPTDSMATEINLNDIAIVDTKIKQIQDNRVYIFEVDDSKRILIRRTHLALSGNVDLLSVNPNFPAISLPLSEIVCSTNPTPTKPTLHLRGEIPWVLKRISRP
jgi:hypothetical protein